jgi:hypothetical protein
MNNKILNIYGVYKKQEHIVEEGGEVLFLFCSFEFEQEKDSPS